MAAETLFSGVAAANAQWYASLLQTTERATPPTRSAWGRAMATCAPRSRAALVFPHAGLSAAEACVCLVKHDAASRAQRTRAEREARHRRRAATAAAGGGAGEVTTPSTGDSTPSSPDSD
jgi:hypothetical protein